MSFFSNKLKNKINSMNWDRESTKHSEWKSNNNGKIMENANQRTRNYENDVNGSIRCFRLPSNLSRQKWNNVHLPTKVIYPNPRSSYPFFKDMLWANWRRCVIYCLVISIIHLRPAFEHLFFTYSNYFSFTFLISSFIHKS